MADHTRWWRAWAPYWEAIEDRHLSLFVADRFYKEISQPVLVVGAGQGLVVGHLRDRGIDVRGVDLDEGMIALARERRGLDIERADAADLPFEDAAFRTTIVASGVVDYLDDDEKISRIISEAHRVTRPRGDVMVAFYRLPPKIAGIYRKIGVITEEGRRYHPGRLFEISRLLEKGILAPIPRIASWTGSFALPTFMYWGRLGLTLPAQMKEDHARTAAVMERAAGEGADVEELYASVPDSLPYRDERAVADLLVSNGMRFFEISSYDDCILAKHRKFDMGEADRAPRPEGDWAVRAVDLAKRYPGARSRAVDGLSITVDRGTIYGLLGPNGAGKTTTISMLCGLMIPDSGRVDFAGGARGNDLRRMIGFVPQELALYPKITARDNLVFFGKMYGIGRKELERKADELMEMVGLADRKHDLVQSYSTGMMRRLNLAVGLVHSPEIIFMDEPTVGIDPQSRNCIFEAVQEIRSAGSTILYTTHYMEEASRLCDRIAIIDRGRVILEDDPRDAVDRYGHLKIELAREGTLPTGLEEAITSLDGVQDTLVGSGRVTVHCLKGNRTVETVTRIQERARAMGVDLALRSVVEPNLESLFLDITGKSLRDEG